MDQRDKIDAYLNNTLQKRERQRFEKAMAKDPQLSTAVQVRRRQERGFPKGDRSMFIQTSDEIVIPGSVILLFGFILFFVLSYGIYTLFMPSVRDNLSDEVASQKTLFEKYYKPFPNYINLADYPEGEGKELRQKAMTTYEAKVYDRAIGYFEALKVEEDPDMEFYLGLSYLEQNELENAITSFLSCVDSELCSYNSASKWYLGLAYVKDQNYLGAQEILRSLKNDGRLFAKESSKLLKDLP